MDILFISNVEIDFCMYRRKIKSLKRTNIDLSMKGFNLWKKQKS